MESETGDDSKIGSDDEIASVHDEEQSKDTNDVSAEGCSELAKRKLELEEEELKPHVKKSKVSKKERKTKLEKSIAVLSDSFKDAAEREMDMLMKLEQMRHKEMLEHEIRLKELDNERRREERQHELMLLNLLNNNRNPYPPQMMDFYKGNNSAPVAVKAVILSFKTKVLKGSMLWPVERFSLLKQVVVSCSAKNMNQFY